MAEETGIFEVMYNCRAMRRLKADPVPEALLIKLIDAANQGPSGSNRQPARWIVVRDAEQRRKLAELNAAAVDAYVRPTSGRPDTLPHQSADARARQLEAVLWQRDHMHEIPALIIACVQFDAAPSPAQRAGGGGSIWPQVQNLLLAARALGLGAAPTTLGLSNRDAAREVLALPDDIEAYCLIPVGFPIGRFGPVTRLPVEETMRWDRWH
ncbi:MAG: nitroreductase family protein [Gammaproteobacteria bacterium]